MEKKEERATEPLYKHPINTGDHAANDIPVVVIDLNSENKKNDRTKKISND